MRRSAVALGALTAAFALGAPLGPGAQDADPGRESEGGVVDEGIGATGAAQAGIDPGPPGVAAGKDVAVQPAEADRLERAIAARLAEHAAVAAEDVRVDVHGPQVTLFGLVPDEEARQAAILVAHDLVDRRFVRAALEVVPLEERVAVGDRDDEIEGILRERYDAREDLKDSAIYVDVANGVVRLTGTAVGIHDHRAATDVAREVPGVRAVVNDLDVASLPTSPGAERQPEED